MDRYPFDAEYLRRLRDGDPATAEHFDNYFKPRLTLKWRRRRFSMSEVDDIIGATYERIFKTLRSPEGIKSPQSFGAYVFTTSRNIVMERYRERSREDPLDDVYFEIVSPEPDGEQKIIREEERDAVHRTLRLMKPREAQILIGVYINGQHKDEVCAEHHITRSNLRLVLHRAIVRFKFLYQSEKGKPPRGERPLSEP